MFNLTKTKPATKPQRWMLMAHARPGKTRQSGIVIWVALIVLLVMTLTGLALVRSTGTNTGIAGNMALKQSATSGADLGLEEGRALLNTLYMTAGALGSLDVDHAPGYFASVNLRTLPEDFGWDSNAIEATADDGLGNRIRYIVHRLCKTTGKWDDPGQECVQPSGRECPGASEVAGSLVDCNSRPMYRITSRADGPRGTVSYVQMIVY